MITPCIYFILDTGTNKVKIGFASNLEQRLKELRTGAPSELIVVATIPCLEQQKKIEEKKAHKFFKKYSSKNRHNREWFKPEILPFIPAYVKERKGSLTEKNNSLNNKKSKKVENRFIINTLWGPETVERKAPRCYFFPDFNADLLTRAGIYEKYRTISWRGKRIYISKKFHDIMAQLRKEGY
jgi:hypothetical protein